MVAYILGTLFVHIIARIIVIIVLIPILILLILLTILAISTLGPFTRYSLSVLLVFCHKPFAAPMRLPIVPCAHGFVGLVRPAPPDSMAMGPSRQTPFLAYFGILVSFWFDFHPHPARWTRRDSLIWFWIWEILKLPHVFNPIANRNVHGLSLSLSRAICFPAKTFTGNTFFRSPVLTLKSAQV